MQARLWTIILGLWVCLAPFGPGPARAQETVENGVDRPGGDYKNFEMEPTIAGFAPCQSACTQDPSCRAWTYVIAGLQGPKPHCWLKNAVPPAHKDKCCVSGVRTGVAGCSEYARDAQAAAVEAGWLGCGFTGPRWSDFNDDHYVWCIHGNQGANAKAETAARETELEKCRRAHQCVVVGPNEEAGGGSSNPKQKFACTNAGGGKKLCCFVTVP